MLRGLLMTLAEGASRSDVLDEMRPPADPMPPPGPEVAALFAEAQGLFGSGQTAKAARSIEKALKKAPTDVACLALAVMIQTIRGDRQAAEAHGRRAVSLSPRVAALHVNLGNCLRDQGKYEEALGYYGQALALAPNVIQARFNLAQCLGQLNRRDEAKEVWRAVAALEADTLPERLCRAMALLALARLPEAEPLLQQILTEAPAHTVAKMEMASVYRRTRRQDQAELLLAEVTEAEPDNWTAHMLLTGLFNDMGRFADAQKMARRAMELNPNDPNVLIVAANTLSNGGELREAEALARKALAREPGTGQASHRHVLGVILERQGRYAEAGQIFETVAADEPEEGWARLTLAFHLLRQGDFKQGWSEHEWRWRWEQSQEAPRDYAQPRWTRAARKNSRVLVWAEQGLGDSVQFVRFVGELASLGYQPIVEVQAPLKTLIASNLPFPIFAYGEAAPAFDYQIPFLSLPYALSVEPGTIPGRGGYLTAPTDQAAKWKERLQPDGRRVVGLSWSGNPLHRNDLRRSIALERLTPLLAVDGIRFVSLQKHLRQDDSDVLSGLGDRIDSRLIEQSEDYADSAGLLANLDLVVSIDGGVAHLAAAMGKPVWMLLPFCPDWRWLTGREDSIWYQSMRLFRQPAPDDWGSVLQRLEGELRRFAG